MIGGRARINNVLNLADIQNINLEAINDPSKLGNNSPNKGLLKRKYFNSRNFDNF